MTITGLEEFLNDIDFEFFRHYKGEKNVNPRSVEYVEPKPQPDAPAEIDNVTSTRTASAEHHASASEHTQNSIASKVVTLGDFIDTDALAPGPTLTTCKTDEEFGQHVLEYTHPDFRAKVKGGQQIVVAGRGMGVGSSRECAVSALKGAGVKAVIARSFAFIYSRNQPSLGLLGIVMEDEDFYSAAQEGEDISIDIGARSIEVAGKTFPFRLSNMEYKLTVNNGIANTYGCFGKTIWQRLMQEDGPSDAAKAVAKDAAASLDSRLNW